MAKTTSLQKRPEPPNVVAMIEDIQATGGDDVLFHVMDSYTDDDFSPTDSSLSESLLDPTTTPQGSSSPSEKRSAKPSDISAETTYLQVQRLIELQGSLLGASQDLQETYEQLQKQGANVSQSLAEFRQKAESSMK